MTASLSQFQDAFIDALYAEPSSVAGALASQPAFSVYRNTLIKACVDALESNYPSVTVLAGAEWSRGAALAYARSTAPSSASLHAYGQSFPEFLAPFAGGADVPYLADAARLDRCWNMAHAAGDHAALRATDMLQLTAEELGGTRLRPHPSASWLWFPDMPVYTIWNASRALRAPPHDLAWQGEGALLVRRDDAVQWQMIDAGACAFLDACASETTLEQACGHALLANPAQDISGTLALLINAGVFCAPGPAAASFDGTDHD